MIPIAVPDTSGNEAKYLQECIETNFVSTVGPFVKKFEEQICIESDAKYGVATCSGTAGLHLALTSVGVTRDDLVIMPSFTFIASANAISQCGAVPWLFDVSSESWTLDVVQLRTTLINETEVFEKNLFHKSTGRRVAAILPVYTLGHPADMEQVKNLAEEFNLPIVADAAAGLGSRYRNQNLGSLADLTVFSFNGNKTITSGGGGMVVGNDKNLVEYARHLSTTARVGEEYHHDEIGFNYRLTNIQAAVGCAQIERLSEFVEKKRYIDAEYRKHFSSLGGIKFFPRTHWATSACWFTGITIEDKRLPSVSTLCKLLKSYGIQARTFWKPIHQQPAYNLAPKEQMLVSNSISSRILTLPCSTQLTKEDQGVVADAVNLILRNSDAK